MGRKRVNPTHKDLATLKHNPFVNDDFIIRVRKREDPRKFVKDGEEWIKAEFNQEVETSTRVYNNSEIRQRVALLSHPAAAMLLWIQQELEPSKDYVVINRQRYVKEHQLQSETQIIQAMYDLTRYLFICPTLLADVYWVNPKIMFNGNRQLKYRKHIKVVD